MLPCIYVWTDAEVSLEKDEYLVTVNDSSLSIPVNLSNVTSQDVVVVVNITDETALGKHNHKYSCM